MINERVIRRQNIVEHKSCNPQMVAITHLRRFFCIRDKTLRIKMESNSLSWVESSVSRTGAGRIQNWTIVMIFEILSWVRSGISQTGEEKSQAGRERSLQSKSTLG